LKKWKRGGIEIYEVVNSPIHHSGDDGTLRPDMDLREEHSEKFFQQALAEFAPDIIQIQELVGLPTSLIELAQARSIPLVHTLHDYYPLCPTVKLYDREGAFCVSREVGAKCVECCAQAKLPTVFNLLGATMWYAANKPGATFKAKLAYKTLRTMARVPKKVVREISQLKSRRGGANHISGPQEESAAQLFQHRRDVNVARLNQLDLLITQSHRQAEIYHSLGVERGKLIVPSTQKHIEHLKSKLMQNIVPPINFATLNGCNTKQKGAGLILEAVRRLHALGLSDKFKLYVLGYVAEEVKSELQSFDNVICTGTYQLRDLERLLEDVHVGIVPSIWEEAYGIVGIELLARGIPVIGNKIGGIVDYTRAGETGWINEANTAKGLTGIMAGIISEPAQVSRLNQKILANRTRIVKSMKAHYDEMDALYREVISARERRHVAGAA
jgi:glycosyltransferase involved in cell wall biosynthesis